ncbi:hypothetical protein Tco_0893687 [Tanacetum coccineum]|uniref:Transposase (putative) gypsy type domain-containing protein n=1 Tax=Tanacetum coccineum TaxID=301880 RepID=A0ABQ5CA03_9ASTR
MALKSSRVVVLPKFDMHIYTSDLTSSELKEVVEEYCIPLDLHPRLPHPDMTMNRLPSRYIGLYIEQLEQGGLRVPFSSFFLAVIKHFGVHVSQLVPMGVNRVILFEVRCISLGINPSVSLFRVFYKLCKQGHWFSFENKTGRGTRKCFKEVTSSLKGWKKKFFLIDRRAIPDAMPWRHGDTDLHDDFPTNYSANDSARLSEVLVPLRPPPRHLLYMCGLTTACRHPELRYDIKDQNNNVIDMDTFLKLPSWTGTIVSRGGPIPEDQRPKPRVTPPLETEAEAKRGGAEANEEPKKRRKVQKPHVSMQSGSEGTLSATPLNQAEPKTVWEPTPPGGPDVVGSHVQKEVVDLSGNTLVSTPPVAPTQPSAQTEPPTAQKPATSEGHSSQSSHPGHEDELLVSHLATPAEDEFLGGLSNVEVVSSAYQTLGQSVLAQGELLKRHEQLSHDFVDLVNRNDANLTHSECPSREKELLERVKDLERERDELRFTASNQVERIQSLEKELEPRVQKLAAVEDQIKVLEDEKLALSVRAVQAETERHNLIQEFIPTVVRRLHTSVEYRQSLAAPVSLCFTVGWLGGLSLGRGEDEIAQMLSEAKDLDIEGSKSWEAQHRERFTKSYPYIQKIADSCDLPMDELLRVSLNVPSAAADRGSTSGAGTGEASQQPPLSAP